MTPIGDTNRPQKRLAFRGNGRIFTRRGKFYIGYQAPMPVAIVDPNGVRRTAVRSREIREVAGATEKAARRLLRERLRQVLNHKAGIEKFKGPQQEKVTLEELLQLLERDYEIHGRRSAPQLKSHLRPLRAFFSFEPPALTPRRESKRPASAGRPLGSHRYANHQLFASDLAILVTHDRLQEYIGHRLREQAAPATVNRELEALRRAFALAKESGKITFAPPVTRLTENNSREGFFERAEFESVLHSLGDPDVQDFCQWMYLTGMRPGEIRALGWDGFDRETWTLRLHAKSAKTGYGRALILTGPYRTVIERRLKARRLASPLIFDRGGRPMGEFRKRWKRACQAAGVKGRLLYDLRRTAVRNMVRAGVPERVAMEVSGHRTRSVFERYNIVSEADLKAALERTAAYVESLPLKLTIVPLRPVPSTKPNQEATQ